MVLIQNCLLSQGAEPRTLGILITSTESKPSSSSTLQLLSVALLLRTPFSNYVPMRTRCLVLRPQTVVLGLRTKLRSARGICEPE